MRVLFLNQAFYPDSAATAQQLVDLSEFLVERGYQVSVICGKRGYDDKERSYPARENWNGISIRRVGSTAFGKKTILGRLIDFLTFDLALVFELLKTESHDVVVSFTSPPLIGFIGSLAAWRWKAKSIQWLMDVNPDAATAVGYLKKGTLIERFLNACFEFSLKKSSRVVVLDRWMQKKIETHGVDSSRIDILPPWPVQEYEKEAYRSPKDNPFRKEFGINDEFVVLYSGNHSLVHPLDTLLESALLLRNEKRVLFCFVGGGVRVSDVTAYKKAHGLSNILQIPTQPRDRLKDSLSFADLHVVVMGEKVNGLVHPSKIYGILASGRPFLFIGPRDSHVGDIIGEVLGGRHVDHGEPKKIVEYIQSSLAQQGLNLTDVQKKNTAYVSEKFGGLRSKEAFLAGSLGGL